MYCKNCGKEINDAHFCPYCGTKAEIGRATNNTSSFSNTMETTYEGREGFAVAALAVAIMAFFIPFLFIVAIILGCIGLKSRRRGLARTGIILGSISSIISIISFGIVIPTTIAVINRQKRQRAVKKVESVYSTARNVLMEAEYTEDSLGGYVIIIGSDYSVTVTSLMSHGDIDSNPFENGGADGGMTVHLNTTTQKFTCDISGTIDGYTIIYDGYSFKAK